MNAILASATFLLVALGASGPTASSRVVYLDPIQEAGHSSAAHNEGRRWAFEMARSLNYFLSEHGISTVIASPDGRSLSLEERAVSARLQRASVYLAIRTSEHPDACLLVHLPLQQPSSHANQGLGGVLDKLAAEQKQNTSACVADSIERTMQGAGLCVRRTARASRQTASLLKRVDSATIVLEFAGSPVGDSRFGVGEGQKTQVARAMSSGITECLHGD